MDIPVAVVWLLFSLLAAGLCTLGWVVLAKTTSRKNGVHALVASLLASRVIFCLSVTSLYAIYVFLKANWSVLACHALYWLWTVTWVSDIIGGCACSVWGLVKLRHLQSSFRLGATIAVTGTWLLATTSAGILAYFNRRIKSEVVLEESGCLVLPLVEEAGLATGVLCMLVVGVLTSVGLLVAFQLRLIRLHQHVSDNTHRAPVASHISVDARTVNGQIAEIRREPSRLEAIEEYCVRPGSSNRRGPDVEEKHILRDWRNLLCAATGLILLLNVTPHMVNLCLQILRHTYVPQGDIIVLSCHLANSVLFPIIMVTISKEYRQALLVILKGRNRGNKDPRRQVDNNGDNTHRRPAEHVASIQRGSNLKSNGHQGLSNAAFAGTVTVTVTPDESQRTMTPDDSQVSRSASRLSRLEWKEQMMKTGKLSLSPHSMQAEAQVEPAALQEQQSQASRKEESDSDTDTDSDSDTVSNAVTGAFHDSDIDRVLSMPSSKVSSVPGPGAESVDDSSYDAKSTSRQSSIRSSVQGNMSDKGTRNGRSFTNLPKEPKGLRRQRRGMGRRKKKEKIKNERRTQDIYATISRALGLQDTTDIPSRPVSRSDMVYSPTNPFLQTLPEEDVEGDTESERSVEAEIVAITIRGRGSFKRKLKRRGLLPGFMYVTNGGEVGMNQDDARIPVIHHSPAEHHQYEPGQSNTQDIRASPDPRPISRSTNPFIDDIDEPASTPKTQRAVVDSYTREWVTSKQQFPAYDPSPHHSNPFLNYGFQNEEPEGLPNEAGGKPWSSNPFLQDVVGGLGVGQSHNGAEFVTRSAPASPTLQHRTMRPAALAVTAVELLKSKSELWTPDNTRHQPSAFANNSFTDATGRSESYRTEYL